MNHKATNIRRELKKQSRTKLIRIICVSAVATLTIFTGVFIVGTALAPQPAEETTLVTQAEIIEADAQHLIVPDYDTDDEELDRDSFSVTVMSDAEKREAALAYARSKVASEAEWQCLYQLWNKESGWRWNAENKESGAYGIPQAWPANKLSSMGEDWRTNWETQIDWGLWYIAHSSYRTPCAAWQHSIDLGWY